MNKQSLKNLSGIYYGITKRMRQNQQLMIVLYVFYLLNESLEAFWWFFKIKNVIKIADNEPNLHRFILNQQLQCIFNIIIMFIIISSYSYYSITNILMILDLFTKWRIFHQGTLGINDNLNRYLLVTASILQPNQILTRCLLAEWCQMSYRPV